MAVNESSFFFEDPPEIQTEMYASFLLENDDSITVYGVSVEHVFFEMNKKFPEGFQCRAIGFSGKDKEDSSNNLKAFLDLVKKYK